MTKELLGEKIKELIESSGLTVECQVKVFEGESVHGKMFVSGVRSMPETETREP